MTNLQANHNRQHGGILLPLAITVFIVSLAAAGYITYRLWENQALPVAVPIAQPSPLSTPSEDPSGGLLNPVITIDSELTEHTAQVQNNLIAPLRQYYATRDERIQHIMITSNDSATHPAQVELTLDTPDGIVTTSFVYDYTTPWQAAMLDQTNETQSPTNASLE